MKFDWKAFSLKMITLAPLIIAGIEQIHGATIAGADKRELAQGSLLLAAGVADQVLPQDQKAIADDVAAATGPLIDSIVGIFKATGTFTKKG
jgi:hypothetical protein